MNLHSACISQTVYVRLSKQPQGLCKEANDKMRRAGRREISVYPIRDHRKAVDVVAFQTTVSAST